MKAFKDFEEFLKRDAQRVEKIEQREEILRRLKAYQPRCGNCSKWMTRACVPEQKYGSFCSMSSEACRWFEETPRVTKDREHWEQQVCQWRQRVIRLPDTKAMETSCGATFEEPFSSIDGMECPSCKRRVEEIKG